LSSANAGIPAIGQGDAAIQPSVEPFVSCRDSGTLTCPTGAR